MEASNVSRIGAFLIDYLIVSVISVLLSFYLGWRIWFNSDMTTEDFYRLMDINYSVIGFGLFLSIFKDVFHGRSIGKRIIGISVVDNHHKAVPGIARLIFRNITLLIWPIEVLFLLIRHQRIGDKFFSTCVIKKSKNL